MDNLVEEIKEINQENDIFGTYNKAKSICDFLELDSNKEICEKCMNRNVKVAFFSSF